jgi:hypothetical protein
LENGEIKGIGGFGVHVTSGSNCELVGCNIEHINCPGVWVDGGAAKVPKYDRATAILRDCEVHSNNAEGVGAINFARVDIQGACDIHHNKFAGLYAGSGGAIKLCSKDTKCHHNTIDKEEDVRGCQHQMLEEDDGVVIDKFKVCEYIQTCV